MFRTQTRVGGDLVRYPVCFSSDEKCIFSCVGGVIKAHNASNGALQGEFRGHTARVTGVFLNPLNSLQLYSTSHDGTIRRWDPSEGMCLQQYDLGIPVLTGSIAAGHHLYLALDPNHYTKFLPKSGTNAIKDREGHLPSTTTATTNTNLINTTNTTTPSSSSSSSQLVTTSSTSATTAMGDNATKFKNQMTDEVEMPSLRDEQRAKNLAYNAASASGQNAIYICAFDLLTPQNATISTDFFGDKNNTDNTNTKDQSITTTNNNNQSLTQMDNIDINIDTPSQNPLQLLFTMKEFTAMSRSRNGDLLCAVGGNKIHVYSKSLRLHGVTDHPLPITCVDVHPKQDLIAVGDISGRITLYVNSSSLLTHSIDAGDNDKKSTKLQNRGNVSRVVTSVLHWHSHPVRSAKFSVDGNYLLSGGYEGVLVTWQLSNRTSHFLPRLSSFIQHIAVSPKGGVYSLSCGDNSIQTLGAFNSQLKHVAHGVNSMNPTNRLISTSNVQTLNSSNKVVLITDQGHFQVFDVAHDLHVCTFYLLDRNLLPENQLQMYLKGGNHSSQHHNQSLTNNQNNNITNTTSQFTLEQQQRAQRITSSLDVTNVLVSPDGRWSCGFYQTPSKHGLRIWAHSADLSPSAEFISRCVWHDENNLPVISGTFASDSKFMITGHHDGNVRLWELTTAIDADTRYPPHLRYMAQTWTIQNTIEYQNLPPTIIVLSEDRTLMAIGFGNVFTLWSVDQDDGFNVSFLFSHTFAGAYTEILSICFLPQYPTIYVATQHGLYTFDLLTLTCVGTYFCNISGMVTHPTLPLLFVMTVVPHITHKQRDELQLQLQQNSKDNKKNTKNNKKSSIATTATVMMDNDSDSEDQDEVEDDQRVLQELTKADDYKGDEVDGLIAQSPNNITPGATGCDMTCPIYRRLFKYLYRTHVLSRFVEPGTKHIPSLRTLPIEKLQQAQNALNVTLPRWTPHERSNKKKNTNNSSNDDVEEQDDNNNVQNNNNTNTPTPHNLLTKPTKECCLLVFSENRHDTPDQATSLFDVMLTKTKVNNSNNNPYNTSCYEASLTLTQDFFIYLNRSRELTLIPITPYGLSTIKHKSFSTSMHWSMNSTLRDIYNLEVHSSNLATSSTLPSELNDLRNRNNDNTAENQPRNPQMDRLLGTLANTPAHQITSLSSIYEQFMTPFLPAAK